LAKKPNVPSQAKWNYQEPSSRKHLWTTGWHFKTNNDARHIRLSLWIRMANAAN